MTGIIVRLEFGEKETIGVFMFEGRAICWTLELPWKRNKIDVSCIPTGRYLCNAYHSGRFGRTFEIVVEGRGRNAGLNPLIFHWGNTHIDTTGCPLVGSRPGYLYGRRAILKSKTAFKIFQDGLKDVNHFILEVVNGDMLWDPRKSLPQSSLPLPS